MKLHFFEGKPQTLNSDRSALLVSIKGKVGGGSAGIGGHCCLQALQLPICEKQDVSDKWTIASQARDVT